MENVQEIEIKTTLQTDTLPQSFNTWGTPAKNIQNTGIERDGGITNLYKNTLTSANTYFTKSGHKIQLTSNGTNRDYSITVDGISLGKIPAWSVVRREIVPIKCDDVCMAYDGNLITATIEGSTLVIRELDKTTLAQINSKNVSVGSGYFAVSIIRNTRQTFTNTTEFVLINNTNFNIRTNIGNSTPLLPTGFAGTEFQISAYATGRNTSTGSGYAYIIHFNSYTLNVGNTYLMESTGVLSNTLTTAGNLLTAIMNGDTDTDANDYYVYNTASLSGTGSNIIVTRLRHYSGTWAKTELVSGTATPTSVLATFGNCIYQKTNTVYQDYMNNFMLGGAFANQTVTTAAPTDAACFQEIAGDVYPLPVKLGIMANTINKKNAYYSMKCNGSEGFGVPITPIGGINGLYLPSTDYQDFLVNKDTFSMVYKTDKNDFMYLNILLYAVNSGYNIFEELDNDHVYINVNTIMNIVNLKTHLLEIGNTAYNSQAIIESVSTGTSAAHSVASQVKSEKGLSVDIGEMYITTTTTATKLIVPYINSVGTPTIYAGITQKKEPYLNNYFDLNYVNSYSLSRLTVFTSFIETPIYIPSSIIPAPCGSKFYETAINIDGNTFMRENSFAGYQIGNEISGIYESFMLFGQTYFFDGLKIYAVNLSSSNIILQIVPIVDASGMTLICQSPTTVFFLSDFDNSIYTFDGGRSLTKQIRMSQKSAIVHGVFGVEENTLALKLTNNNIIFMRDALMSEISTSGGELRATVNGIILANSSGYTRYSYNTNTLSGEVQTVEPLVLQTAYYGTDRNALQSTTRWVIRLYNSAKDLTTVTITGYSFTQDKILNESKTFTIGDVNNAWDSDGYAFISYIPSSPRNIATSLKIETAKKLTITDVYAYTDVTDRNVTKNKG